MILSKEDAEEVKGLLSALISFDILYGWYSMSGRNEDITILMDRDEWEYTNGVDNWFI